MDYGPGQEFNYNTTQSPPSPPDSGQQSPFYQQQPQSPKNLSFVKSQPLLRTSSPFPHSPSPTNQPTSETEFFYNKSISPNETSYAYLKSSDPIIRQSQGELQNILDPTEEPFLKSSSPEPTYPYTKPLDAQPESPPGLLEDHPPPGHPDHRPPGHLDHRPAGHLDHRLDGHPTLAYPHYLQEDMESCFQYQVGTIDLLEVEPKKELENVFRKI